MFRYFSVATGVTKVCTLDIPKKSSHKYTKVVEYTAGLPSFSMLTELSFQYGSVEAGCACRLSTNQNKRYPESSQDVDVFLVLLSLRCPLSALISVKCAAAMEGEEDE